MNVGKIIGGTLLVSGTTIGVGLLGLPATCAFMGFYPSMMMFVMVWLFMLGTGVNFVDIVCEVKHESNIITMAEKKLGRWGMGVSWISYLLLLYSLMALYISASAPLFQEAFLKCFNSPLSSGLAKFALPLLFGWVIYLGTRGVDIINRLLMIGLIVSYFLLVSLMPTQISGENLSHMTFTPFLFALPSVITGFGYHIVIPSLGTYMDYDRKSMITSVVVGSVISLVINLIWQFMIMGVLPLEVLAKSWQAGGSITPALAGYVSSGVLAGGVYFFSFFAILTSFLGVGLSLSDFLIDGLNIKKSWEGRLLAIALTFVPPMIFVFSYARGFMMALAYAGAFVAILLVFIPAAMAWKAKRSCYKTPARRSVLVVTMAFAGLVVFVNFLIRWGYFTEMLDRIGGLS